MSDIGENPDKRDTPEANRERDERRANERRQMTREPLRDNPEVMEREQMRTNPEVMGRKEPVAMEDPNRTALEPKIDRPGRVGGPGEKRSDIWPDMSDFHTRWSQLQSDFIEDPRQAVKKAEQLVVEMLDHVTKSMRERMTTSSGDVEAKGDTEHLRLTMQRYKQFVNSFGHPKETV